MQQGRPPRHGTASDLLADRARALALTPVSRETSERLDRFVELLLSWQRRTNLIAPSTVSRLWTRHIADSLQLLDLAPQARIWADLGSGAGFPGLVIATALAGERTLRPVERPAALEHAFEVIALAASRSALAPAHPAPPAPARRSA